MTGAQLKAILEDVADNLFNPDPYYQQGGDMVRAGGMDYACAPNEAAGSRISDIRLNDGTSVEADKSYRVAGWASVNPQQGDPVPGLVETYLRDNKKPDHQTRQSRDAQKRTSATILALPKEAERHEWSQTRSAMIQLSRRTCRRTICRRRTCRTSRPKPHRIVIQVDQNDADVMNLALNNARNLLDYYRARKNEDIDIEIVAYGPGLHMLREDTSPVKDRIKQLSEVSFPSKIVFSACNNTKEGMEKREGHPIAIIPQAGLVPAGVVRIMELQEQGYG